MANISIGKIEDKINGIPVNFIQCNAANYTNATNRDVKYCIIHWTSNAKDTSTGNCNYFKNNKVSASAHLFVDETTVSQSVELRDTAWAIGCSMGYKTPARNLNSISIEMCQSGNYIIADKTQINAAYLCAYICKKIGVKANEVDTYVLRHYDCVASNKPCPKPFIDEPNLWTNFKTMVKNILNTGSHVIGPKFELNKTYTLTKESYLRSSAEVSDKNKIKFSSLSDTLKKKCSEDKEGYAKFKKGSTFTLTETKTDSKGNVWGKLKSGFYLPICYNKEKRI